MRFRCPWCSEHGSAGTKVAVNLEPGDVGNLAVLVVCPNVQCRRPVMVTAHGTFEPYEPLETAIVVAVSVHPSPRAKYDEPGVPDNIARDFTEALNCQGAGFLYGAAVVGRRALRGGPA